MRLLPTRCVPNKCHTVHRDDTEHTRTATNRQSPPTLAPPNELALTLTDALSRRRDLMPYSAKDSLARPASIVHSQASLFIHSQPQPSGRGCVLRACTCRSKPLRHHATVFLPTGTPAFASALRGGSVGRWVGGWSSRTRSSVVVCWFVGLLVCCVHAGAS